MSDVSTTTAVSGLRASLRSMISRPAAVIGLVVAIGHLLIALLGPLIVPYDSAAQDSNVILQAPSWAHLMGTDRFGRDVFTRTLLGGREAMLISTLSVAIAMIWGTAVGLGVALTGGRVDQIVMRTIDALMSIPWIMTVMIFVAALGVGIKALIPVLGFSYGLSVVYLARGAALDFVARDFVLAAQARGERRRTIIFTEIFPNVRDSLAVQAAMQWSWILLGVSSLSFLGLGVAPPTPDWGVMIAENRGIMQIAPWTVLWPMAALSSLIVAVNFASDGLAKALGIDRVRRAP
ncbi:MAG: ABC transporter permease [Dongiaceae bacterium]